MGIIYLWDVTPGQAGYILCSLTARADGRGQLEQGLPAPCGSVGFSELQPCLISKCWQFFVGLILFMLFFLLQKGNAGTHT